MKIFIQCILLISMLFLPVGVSAKKSVGEFVDQWAYKDINLYSAWDLATGSGDVIVAVVDNGFDTFHPDLFDNVWKNEGEIEGNGIDDDGNGFIDDVWGWDFSVDSYFIDKMNSDKKVNISTVGDNDPRPSVFDKSKVSDNIHHASLIAGIIGAVGGNGRDIAGVNWRVKLMNVKVVDHTDSGRVDSLVRGIRYAVDNGADIVNLSLVSHMQDSLLRDAVRYAFDNGVLVVAAAGNNAFDLDDSPGDPICADNKSDTEFVLGVSAIDESHRIYRFSNTGKTCIDITAPGVGIISTQRYAPQYGLVEPYGGLWSGTSFAAPFVSGAAALIKSIQPTWGPTQLFEALTKTTHRTPPSDPVEYERLFGAGLLQIDRALQYALSRRTVITVAKHIMTIDRTSGMTWKSVFGKDTGDYIRKNALRNIDDVIAYGGGFVVTKKFDNKKRSVIIYDKTWIEKKKFTITANGEVGVRVGNIVEGDEPEMILYPKYIDTWVGSIRNFSGQELQRYSSHDRHSGVMATIIPSVTAPDKVALLYKNSAEVAMVRIIEDKKLKDLFPVDFINGSGVIGAGDVDGDGTVELVIGGGVHDTPFLVYYELDGSIIRKVYAYSGLGAGYDMAVADINRDDKVEVITAPRMGDGPIRIWNGQATKIGEWSYVGEGGNMNLQIIPIQ
jgi:hypothetical protein